MKRYLKNRRFVLRAALCLSLAGFVLRLLQRRLSLLPDGSHSGRLLWPLVILSAAALVLAVGAAYFLTPRKKFRSNHPRSVTLLLLPVASALFAVSAFLRFFSGSGRVLLGLSGLAAAACLLLIGLSAIRRQTPPALFALVLTVSVMAMLIYYFRVWTVDPAIGDYCFRLFAMIALLCFSFQLSSFSLGTGRRREAVFHCVAGLFFSVVSLADGGAADALFFLACALLFGSELWGLMSVRRKRRI